MPTYIYKAATKNGMIVRNRVESSSKQNLIKAIKDNDMIPINIEQFEYRTTKIKNKQKTRLKNRKRILGTSIFNK